MFKLHQDNFLLYFHVPLSLSDRAFYKMINTHNFVDVPYSLVKIVITVISGWWLLL